MARTTAATWSCSLPATEPAGGTGRTGRPTSGAGGRVMPDDRSADIGADALASLRRVLDQSRHWGFLGPGDVDEQIARSLGFVAAWRQLRDAPPRSVLDLGSGGGVPGLVLLLAWPDSSFVLLDSNHRRITFLADALASLRAEDRAEAILGRAEEAARGRLRRAADLVVARGFAPPAVTAECGAAFVREGGVLAVAEPPGGDGQRWPDDGLRRLGLRAAGLVTEPASVRLLEAVAPLDGRYPRRTGVPAKRPLWRAS
jgi:16S rRNA (guanine527-N7)-methyltransferase